MSHQYRCPQGHSWSGDPAGVETPGDASTCPVCGSVGDGITSLATVDPVRRADGDAPDEGFFAGQQTGMAPPPPRAPSGTRLSGVPGYEILGVLGRGGVGVVY